MSRRPALSGALSPVRRGLMPRRASPVRVVGVRLRRAIHRSRLAQIGLLVMFWLAGDLVVALTGLPLPGSIVGLALAFALLASGRLSLFSVRRGADWFLARMLLFFVPAVLAVIDHHELFGLVGLKIVAVIAIGTAAVMATTALTVDLCCRGVVRKEETGHDAVVSGH
ncbi:holin-like protein [Pseudoxanthobacter soli DSM 19599]|uniref:Holin-like protein n=2 Tax=Pseudoxanthobacter TaxID=433838 RepID=A0A1M7ZP86_9HYPH|nr:holin-like protein [Pseudoxanthobacter soli DSM 19599]